MSNDTASTRVVTGRVRLSYPNLFAPKAIKQGDKEKYGASFIFPKTDTVTYQKIMEAMAAVKAAGSPKIKDKNGKLLPDSKLKMPFPKDGDEDYPDDPAYANSWYISASSITKPGVVEMIDKLAHAITDPAKVYAGCYVRASLNFFPYGDPKAAIAPGISAGLNGVCFLADGEPLSGCGNIADDFNDDFEDDDSFLD